MDAKTAEREDWFSYQNKQRSLTMDAKHTEGPWESFGNGIARQSDPTCIILMPPRNMRPADIERTVACVNACEGINPDAVPDLLAAAERALNWIENGEFEDRNYEGEVGNVMRPLRAAINKAKGA